MAERRIAALLEAEAEVRVVSPAVTAAIGEWIEEGRVQGRLRAYRTSDLEEASFVFAATDDEKLNLQVYEDALAGKRLVNLVDRPDLSRFVVPASVRRGKLLFSVSTSGASPSEASRMAQAFARQYGPEYEVYLDFLYRLRKLVRARVDDPARRRAIHMRLARMDGLARIGEERFAAHRREWLERLSRADDIRPEDLEGLLPEWRAE